MKPEKGVIKIGIPQILLIAIYMLSLGIELANHGKTEIKKYDFWAKLLACAIVIGLLKWGGFFN